MQTTWKNTLFIGLLSLGYTACSAVAPQSSLVMNVETASEYERYKNKSFEDICNDPASYSPTVQKTLNILIAKASTSSCNALFHAFSGKKLDLANQGADLALGVLIKLNKVAALDLSGNELSDITQLQLHDYKNPENGNVIHGGWNESLKRLDLKNNRLTDVTPIIFFKKMEEAKLSGNRIVNFEGFGATNNVVYPPLKILDLANNPLDLPKVDGQIDKNAFTYKYLSNNSLVYLDISHTLLPSLQFLFSLKNLSYLNMEGVQAPETEDVATSLFQLTYLNARDSRGWPSKFLTHASKLIYADFSASDLSSLEPFRGKANLDFLLVGQTQVSDFSALPSGDLHPRFLSAYAMVHPTSFAPGTESAAFPIQLLDLQGTAVTTARPDAAAVTLDSCAAPDPCISPIAAADRSMLLVDAFFCKVPLSADGGCAETYASCDASTISIKHDQNDPKAAVVAICCTTPPGVSMELPTLGVIKGEPKPDGSSEMCARFAASEGIFL